MYLDFDGFFASVEQQVDKKLRGKPVGVVPFEGTNRTCVIACSREAKKFGVKNVMPVDEAISKCPELILVPQKPDLYRRAHNTLLAEIESVIPIDAVNMVPHGVWSSTTEPSAAVHQHQDTVVIA